jgi:hypothetical protein
MGKPNKHDALDAGGAGFDGAIQERLRINWRVVKQFHVQIECELRKIGTGQE